MTCEVPQLKTTQHILQRLALFQYASWGVFCLLVVALATWFGRWVIFVCFGVLLVNMFLKYLWFTWFLKWKHISLLTEINPNSKSLGHYTQQEIQHLVEETAHRMKINVPHQIVVYHSKQANAFVLLWSRRVLGLHSNILNILNKEELTAVIGHELAHLKYGRYPSPLLFTLALLTGLKLAGTISRANEYLADYYSAHENGLLPMVNSLLKIYSRAQIFEDILEYLELFKQTYQIPDEADVYFLSLIEARLPHILQGENSIAYYGSEVLRAYIQQRGGNVRSAGRTISQRVKQSIEKVRNRQAWKAHYKKIDWKSFDSHIRDLWIDEVELQDMYTQLKQHKEYHLFLPHAQEHERHRTHPLLQERIIFLIEALQPAYISVVEEKMMKL